MERGKFTTSKNSSEYYLEKIVLITVWNSHQKKVIVEKLFKSLPFNSTAQDTSKTSLSKKYHIEFLVKKYFVKVPSKTPAKARSREKTVLKCSSWAFCTKICPKHHHIFAFDKSWYSNALGKSSVQKYCPKHRQKTRLDKKQYLNARRGNIVHQSYPKYRYKLLSIRKQKKYRNARQKVSNKKPTQKTIKNIATQKRQNWSARQRNTAKKAAQKTVKTCQQKKTVS